MREIEQVVQHVGARGAGRQRHEQPGRQQPQRRFGLVRRDQGSEHEHVLDPLMRAQCPEVVERMAAESGEKPGVRLERAHFPRKARRQIDPDCAPGVLPYGQIAPFVADVIEAAPSESPRQYGGLAPAGQIGAPVRSEVARRPDRFRERSHHQLVGGGGQPDLASRRLCGGDLLRHGRVQRQRGRWQRHDLGDPAFQCGTATGQPQGQDEQAERGGRQQAGPHPRSADRR